MKNFIITIFSCLLFVGCKKDETEIPIAAIAVNNFELVTTVNTAAMFNINFSRRPAEFGVLLSSSKTDPDMSDKVKITGFHDFWNLPSNKSRPCIIDLQKNTTYYAKVYFTDKGSTNYSNTITLTTANEVINFDASYSFTGGVSSVVPGLSVIEPYFFSSIPDNNKFLLYRLTGKLKYKGIVSRDAGEEYVEIGLYNDASSTFVSSKYIPYKYSVPCSATSSDQLYVSVDGVWYGPHTLYLYFPKSPNGTIISSVSGNSNTKIYVVNGAFTDKDYKCIKDITVQGVSASLNSEYINGSYYYYFYPPSSVSAGSGKQVYINMPCSSYYVSDFTKY